MRFCSSDGHLELNTKTGSSKAPKGYRAWFEHSNHKSKHKKILFGHWASLQGETHSNNFIALDTGCVWGGALSMMRLDKDEYHYVDCDQPCDQCSS